ncbi:MAG: energy transducer TonB [Myxococcales bacterium]|nr:energy transducer TonB [Myxococcales bacterium]
MARVLLLVVGLGGLALCAALVVSATATAAHLERRVNFDPIPSVPIVDTSTVSPYTRAVLTLPLVAATAGETGTSRVVAAEYPTWQAYQPWSLSKRLAEVTRRPPRCSCCSPAWGQIRPQLDGMARPTLGNVLTSAHAKKPRRREGTMKLGAIQVSGLCAKSHIRAVIQQRAGAFRHCYQAALDDRARLRGRLVVRLTIDPAGRVRSATTPRSTLGDPRVAGCALGVARRLTFAKPPPDGCVVQWSLDYASRGAL